MNTAARFRRIAEVVAPHVYLEERHLWMELDLQALPEAPALPTGALLRRAGAADLSVLDTLPTIGRDEALRRLVDNVQWWLLANGETPLFSCWVFHHRLPAVAGPDGWVRLPSSVAAVEDSTTAPAARGRGIGPAAWAAVARQLANGSDRWLIRKTEITNRPAIRAGHKAGFRDIAEVHYSRRGPRRRIDVTPADGAANASWLRDRLAVPTDPAA